MSSSIQIVDSMSSVLDLQILAIEKALLSIDKFLQSGLSSDVSRLISSINFNVRGLITKAIEKSNSHNNRKVPVKRDARSSKDINLGSKRLASPNRLKSHMQSTRLDSSQRWKVFLSDDVDFRRFLSGPLKIMTRNLQRLDDFQALQRSLSRWKEAVNVDSKEERTFYETEPIRTGGSVNPYEQEFMWEDPHFNPYEGGEEDEEPIVEKGELDGVTDMEVYNAADGRPLDVDELRGPFTTMPEESGNAVASVPDTTVKDVQNEPWRGTAPGRPRLNFSDDTRMEPRLTSASYQPNPRPYNTSTSSVGSTTINRPSNLLSFSQQLPTATTLQPTAAAAVAATTTVAAALPSSVTSDYSNYSVSRASSELNTVPWPTRQYSYQSTSSVYDDGDGMDDGFELPP